MPATTPSTPLDGFLDGFAINTGSSSWQQILNGPLNLEAVDPPPAPQEIALQSHFFWDLVFSSKDNPPEFGSPPPSSSDAAISSETKDAVLALASSTTPITKGFTEIRGKFFGTAALPPQLQTFIDAFDPTDVINLPLNLDVANRSGLWAISADAYRTVVALTFDAPSSTHAAINDFVGDIFGLAVQLLNPKARLMFKQITSYYTDPTNPAAFSSTSTYQFDVVLAITSFEIIARFNPDGLNLIITDPQNAGPATQSIFDRLSALIIGPSPSSTSPKAGDLPTPGQPGLFNSFFPKIDLWYITLQASTERTQLPDGTVEETAGPIVWRIAMIATWHANVDVDLVLEYNSSLDALNGRLLFDADADALLARRRYDYNWQFDLSNTVSAPLPANLDLWQLFTPGAKPPPQIPSKIIQGSVSFIKAENNGFTFIVAATIISASAATQAKSPRSAPDGFSWDVVSLVASIQDTPAKDVLSLRLFTQFTLNPPSGRSDPPASFAIDIQWSSAGKWVLHGHVEELTIGLLADFFDSSVRDRVVGLMGSLALESLDVIYTYDSTGEASSFLIAGVIVLGDLELDLEYEYASGLLDDPADSAAGIARTESGPGLDNSAPLIGGMVGGIRQPVWTFKAALGGDSPSSTVGSVIKSLSPNSGSLPDFIASIPIGDASGPDAAVKLVLRDQGDYTALSIAITIGDFTFTFISLNTPSSPDAKRILRAEIGKLPLISDIPLVKQLPQPFDQLAYLWLDDDSGKGLFQVEVQYINAELDQLSIPKVLTKDTNNADPNLAVLLPGHHFMVMNKGVVVLDHRFGDADAKSTPAGPATDPTGPVVPSNPPPKDDGPTKGGLQVQLPFVTISSIALDYKKGAILLDFDASVALGPLTFALIGFYIGVELSGHKLSDFTGAQLGSIKFDVGLHGLEVAVNQPPVTIAGVFIHDGLVSLAGMQLDTYRGGISLGFEAWKFIAVGEYGSAPDGSFETVFVYAKLDGPLVTLAFATISGVRLGIGYNSMVRSPSINELASFPFIDDSSDSNSGQDPLALLNKFTNPPSGTPWVTPKADSYWVAAGLTLTAFGILTVTAVLMVGVRDGGFVISVFADGIAQMPPGAPPDITLFYVEIDMLAELNTVDGYFTVQAALAPSSHILVSSCRVTGGFALVNWFSPNANSGDFVFTVGGFHRAYSPPPWYPVPDRLGISFTLGGMINVTGNVYFAITPKCVMGGGALHLGLDVGPVSAWLDVTLDVFIQFKPFHYTADLMVSVGCAISIDVWFVHIRVTASVGAALHIEGPDPFGGTATVDFYLFSFTINFGDKPTPPPGIPLQDFYDMVRVPGPAKDPSAPPDPLDTKGRIKFTVSTGLFPQPLPPTSGGPAPSGPFPSAGVGTSWNIKTGSFSCIIGVDFALSAANIADFSEAGSSPVLTPRTHTNPPSFYSKPMHISDAFTSTMTISVYSIDSDGSQSLKTGFTGEMILKDVPAALWQQYSKDDDPAQTTNPQNLKNPTQPTLNLCMGVTLYAPPSTFTPCAVKDFDPAVAFSASVGNFRIPTGKLPQHTFLASTPIHAAESPQQQWDGFRDDWKAFGVDGKAALGNPAADGSQPDGLLKLAAHWLAWDVPVANSGPPAPPAPGEKLPAVLDGSLPQILLGELANEYPVLPRYSVNVP